VISFERFSRGWVLKKSVFWEEKNEKNSNKKKKRNQTKIIR
jgi:hypothetical protein